MSAYSFMIATGSLVPMTKRSSGSAAPAGGSKRPSVPREVERPGHASSNVVNAHKLQGKVLLVVGELDTNVDPCATMQVVNALIKASKTFDLPVIPGAGHGPGGAYGERKRYDFFVQHLLGVMPPAWNAVADKTPPGR